MRKMSLLAFLILPLLGAIAHAEVEQSREIDNHVIYYNVLPTSALPEAMARAYGFTRSETRIMLNIAVQRSDEEPHRPVEARIDAKAVNLTGQLKRFRMREIKEEEAIYYIGDIRINEGETLDFELSITPEGERRAEVIRFRRAF